MTSFTSAASATCGLDPMTMILQPAGLMSQAVLFMRLRSRHTTRTQHSPLASRNTTLCVFPAWFPRNPLSNSPTSSLTVRGFRLAAALPTTPPSAAGVPLGAGQLHTALGKWRAEYTLNQLSTTPKASRRLPERDVVPKYAWRGCRCSLPASRPARQPGTRCATSLLGRLVPLVAACVALCGPCQPAQQVPTDRGPPLPAGAPLEGQLRLARAAGDADNHYQRSTALYAAAYAASAQQQQQEQPVQEQPEATEQQLSWWRWLWPWGRPEPRRTVAVLPYWADGRQASMVELELPQSHIDRELRPAPAPSGATGAAAAAGTGTGGDESAAAAVAALAGDLFNYNTSAMMPLVPWSWSWMTDAAQLRNRSNGFDIDVARRLSSYVAIAYCDPANLPAWNCTRCNGIAADFETHRVVFDVTWNLLAFVGVSRPLNAIVVSFRGTDSHSLYNW